MSEKTESFYSSLITFPMRLDLFLKASRLCPRRTVAQELCGAGAVSVNGARAKPAREVRVGDEISLRRRNQLTRVRVLSLPERKQLARGDASSLYEILGATEVQEEPFD